MSKYKLKELCDVTAQDRTEIYKYAMKRSNEIVSGQKLETKTKTETQPVHGRHEGLDL